MRVLLSRYRLLRYLHDFRCWNPSAACFLQRTRLCAGFKSLLEKKVDRATTQMLTTGMFGQVSECLVTRFGMSCVHRNLLVDRILAYAALRLVESVCVDAYVNRDAVACIAGDATIDFS